MYEGDLQSVVRCELCGKPFDKQSTLKRHGYYCRSRRDGIATRSRSCISCARGKARCDNQRPQCSRCMTKAVECHYPAKRPQVTRPRVQRSDFVPSANEKLKPGVLADSSSAENGHEARNDGDTVFDSALLLSDPEVTDLGEEYLYWNDTGVNFADFLDPQTNDTTIQFLSSAPPPGVHHSTSPALQVHQANSSFSLSIPTLPNHSARKLIQRHKAKSGAGRIANLILHAMKSYLVMLRHDTLPPFIHRSLMSSEAESEDMEPLTNCLCLVHLLDSRVQGNRKYFWKNVRLECERLCAEHLQLNRWQLLAAMQALSLYILIRLDEGETDYNNLDSLLVTTVIAIASYFNSTYIVCDTHPSVYSYSLGASWKDWVFEESARRLCVVYQVVDMLVYFEPAAMCNLPADLVLAPLPAKKQLWEASDELIWKAESEKEPGPQKDFGLAANGDLVRVDESQPHRGDMVQLYNSLDSATTSRSTANWEEWCSGMDGLGGLVMLAASLIA